jgi:arylsulfatase A-like enzyme
MVPVPSVPKMLARVLSAGVVVVGLGGLVVAAHLWHTETVTVRQAAAEVAGPHEIPPSPPARTPGGLDFRPLPIDMTTDQLQATQHFRIRAGLDRAERRRRGPPGIIVVSMDGLRPDYTTPYGAAPTATPNLAELAKTSTVFTRSYANANETLFSHASFFTSTIPSHLGDVNYDLTIKTGQPTIAMALSYAGYRTGAIVASGHLARVFGLDDGFQEYIEGQRMGSFQETVPMAVRWLEEVAQSEQPYFLFVHGYDVHIPYTKPTFFARSATPGYDGFLLDRADDSLLYEKIYGHTLYPDFPLAEITTHTGTKVLTPEVRDELKEWSQRPDAGGIPLSDDDIAFMKGMYATSAFYADAWLGVLLQETKRLGLWDDLTVIVMSDHGEELLDHGFMNHRNTLEDSATSNLTMIRRPGGRATRVDDVVELLDLGPTILDLAGATTPDTFQGTSLVPCLDHGRCPVDGVAYSEGILRHVSATDGVRRLTVHGFEAASPEVDAELRNASAKSEHITYEDVRGPPGTETPATPDGLFTRLTEAALERRGR